MNKPRSQQACFHSAGLTWHLYPLQLAAERWPHSPPSSGISLPLGFHPEGHSGHYHPMFSLGCSSDRQELGRKQLPSWEPSPRSLPLPQTL